MSCEPSSCAACFKCEAGACTLDLESRWSLVCSRAAITDVDPATGLTWDALGGAPDPFCQFETPTGTLVSRTSVQLDTFFPSWNEVLAPGLRAGDLLSGDFALWVLDLDQTVNEPLCGVTGPMPAASFTVGPAITIAPDAIGGCLSWDLFLACEDP